MVSFARAAPLEHEVTVSNRRVEVSGALDNGGSRRFAYDLNQDGQNRLSVS
jgi:hypothetical protein